MTDVQVFVSNGHTERKGKLADSFLQNALFFAGTSLDGSGGYLAFGPGYGTGGKTVYVV